MLIRSPRRWEIAENQVTSEDHWLDRRRLVKAIAAGPLLAASLEGNGQEQDPPGLPRLQEATPADPARLRGKLRPIPGLGVPRPGRRVQVRPGEMPGREDPQGEGTGREGRGPQMAGGRRDLHTGPRRSDRRNTPHHPHRGHLGNHIRNRGNQRRRGRVDPSTMRRTRR